MKELDFNEDEGFIDADDEELFDEIDDNINIEEEIGYEEIPDKEMEESAYRAFLNDSKEENMEENI